MNTILQKERVCRKMTHCNFCDGVIHVGEKYDFRTIVNDGNIYNWKSHLHCLDIASKLDMFDDDPDGITSESFQESIKDEYAHIMSTKYNDMWESAEYRIPNFEQQLNFVIKEHEND